MQLSGIFSKARRAPLRLASGGFILNAGVDKLLVGPERAELLHKAALVSFPRLERMKPERFATALAVSEIGLGSALLAPMVPPVVVGPLLAAFAAGLLKMYWETPGLRELGSFRPTPKGTAISKDIWLLGIGLALTIDGLIDRGPA